MYYTQQSVELYSLGICYMHYPTDRIAHTIAFVIPVVENWLEQEREREIERSMALWGIDPMTYHTMSIHSTTELHLTSKLEANSCKQINVIKYLSITQHF